ncbi:MAG TPA: hypothetical protein VFU38_06055 [Candidatus Krumholzibacteria bacterium]|nr:hypothetical protein [Candidatus Krumholzibacteria bacterium]
MRRAPIWLLSVSGAFLLLIVACGASTLRRSQSDFSDLAEVRSEYLARHPDSPFNEQVARGEIVRGMDSYAVTASWGLPDRRVNDGLDFERWLYVDASEAVGYALVFEKGVLKTWGVQRPGTGLKTRETTDATAIPRTETPRGKPVPTD